MATYVNDIFNHLRALQTWANGKDMALNLDMKSFALEVKHRGRYFTMFPMFQGGQGGQGGRGGGVERLFHMDVLTRDAVGFGGWRPYRTIQHPLSTDKRLFKEFVRNQGINTPESALHDVARPPAFDYVIKGARGSFGKELSGPYRGGSTPASDSWSEWAQGNETFVEQFIQGRAAKVWFWGRRPIYVQSQDFPVVQGDGEQTLEALIQKRLKSRRLDWDTYPDREVILSCLAFQQVNLSDVVSAGTDIWIDYRFGQRYAVTPGNGIDSDSTLDWLMERAGDQVQQMGEALVEMLRQTIPAPVLMTVDCMIDASNRVWWLEMNTNSLMPPEGYAAMFEDLFR